MTEETEIKIYGAREHNLKDINVTIPRNQLVVITGLSGSGKSSLAFDTIYAEGQRRFIETFSSYARQFLGGLERPDVDKITGLSPVISIEQKTVNRSPRSTVGTITEIYDFLRLLYARASTAYSSVSGEKMVKYSDEQIVDLILDQFDGEKIIILAPRIRGRKGHYRELFEQIQKLGFAKVRADQKIMDIKPGMKLDRYKIHDIEIVIDRIQVKKEHKQRIYESVTTAMKYGNKSMIVLDYEKGTEKHFSRALMCPTSGISYPEPEPNLFSFNSPYGACRSCNGLGEINELEIKKLIPNPKLSIKKGGIVPLHDLKSKYLNEKIELILNHYDYTLDTPIENIEEELILKIINGTEEMIKDEEGHLRTLELEGIGQLIQKQLDENPKGPIKRWATSFMNKIPCPKCEGKRLKEEALNFKILDRNIADIAALDFAELGLFIERMQKELSEKELKIATEIIKEIADRTRFILDVGLDYLTLNRPSKSLSGGEAQRIRLATQIGSELMNVLYILDEPSIGLHQRDNTRLIQSLTKLRDTGNSVIVVEHDKEMIESADYVIDIGPKAGRHGGEIVSASNVKELLTHDTLTAQYLNGKKKIEIPDTPRKGNGNFLELKGASGHNLKNVDLKVPLGVKVCVSGVSGSGKSSLITQTLYPILNKHFYNGVKKPLPYKSVKGLEHIDKVIEIDQSPIGRTPRSNPATYVGMFTHIREMFASLPEAQIRGYKAGRFSFNVKGGRCETCSGAGIKVIEMNFLPDVMVECETCNGKRYNRETLEVRYKGKSISDVLEMTIEQAQHFFEGIPKINRILKTLNSVGLGYVKVGQPSTTLSGGEAQRIKLATELSKKSTGKTFYILDEPSTGLHFEDIRLLNEVLDRLVDEGNTVLIIEHNMDIIKVADYIIDIGPDGGKKGGEIVAVGEPKTIIKNKKSITGKYLINELN
ncbi:MAG: excinuclease ABC subunit UvrA [Crocinitomicaceae bacterium]|nr:excinuclease ABC subunit UvrA [Crocinitomicaceae bacterium]